MSPTTNRLLTQLGIDIPLVQGPMGGVSGPALVTTVANAGGLGILPIWAESISSAVAAIEKVKTATARPFAVNLRADLVQTEHISAAIDSGVDIIHLFWGDPGPSRSAVDAGSARMLVTVGDREAARAALDAGACALIAQGVEAGGHVLGHTPLQELLDDVIDEADDVPVIAAGGCALAADARELLDRGAAGVLLGTRFIASAESDAHPTYKQAIIEAAEDATAMSLCFDIGWPDAPHRNLVNSTFRAWDAAGRPDPGHRPGEGDTVLRTASGRELPRYAVTPPKQGMTGDIEAAVMYAGTGVDRINNCPSAAEIVREFEEAMMKESS